MAFTIVANPSMSVTSNSPGPLDWVGIFIERGVMVRKYDEADVVVNKLITSATDCGAAPGSVVKTLACSRPDQLIVSVTPKMDDCFE
jgi:hypothetical protein